MELLLKSLANLVQEEISVTGTIKLGDRELKRSSLKQNPYAGLCHASIAKMMYLAPKLDLYPCSLSLARGGATIGGNHIVGYYPSLDLIVDPTIRQFLPEQDQHVYKSSEYPIKYTHKRILPRANFL